MNFFSIKTKYFCTVCACILISLSPTAFAGDQSPGEFVVGRSSITGSMSEVRNSDNNIDLIEIDDNGGNMIIRGIKLHEDGQITKATCFTSNAEHIKTIRSAAPDTVIRVRLRGNLCGSIRLTKSSRIMPK